MPEDPDEPRRSNGTPSLAGPDAGPGADPLGVPVPRPWGAYTCVDRGPGFLVKRLTVAPGAALSLQRHRHRAEHWVVVRGRARVTRDGETFDLAPDQSAFIPRGVVHRLANPGEVALEMIEVQTGSWLSEADIERLDDRYGR